MDVERDERGSDPRANVNHPDDSQHDGSRMWRLSTFTRVVEDSSGDILMHNSFMGAVARVNAGQVRVVKPFLKGSFSENSQSHKMVAELCDAGFFVPVDIDERALVNDILAREASATYHLIILPHENCNFRCRYCYESFERGRMRPEVIAGLKRFVANKAPHLKHLSVAWFGGEPLLARRIIHELSDDFRQTCADMGVTYVSGITTNGYLLTPEVVDGLLERRVTAYQVTLDGPEHLHDQARVLASGGGTYRKILNNLIAMRNRSGDFSVKIRVNFGPQHATSQMEAFLSELEPIFADDPRFDLHFHPVGRWGGKNDASLEVCDAASAGMARTEFMRRASAHGFNMQMAKQHLRPHGNVCYAGRDTSLVVDTHGKLYKCTVAFEDPRNQVGTLNESGELTIDQALWDKWTKLNDKNTTKCGVCAVSPSCQSRGCPLVAIQQQEPPCPISASEYEQTVKLVGGLA